MTSRVKPERQFGDFELIQRIGRDGPFHIFRARQISLDRLVTLKVLPERQVTLERSALLRREAEAANRLDHPRVLRVYEAADVGGVPYLALAPIDGATLAERLKSSALPPRLSIDLTRQLADVLAHAHECGVLHGALRPEVVWITRDGQIRLTGFGCPVHFEELNADDISGSAGFLAPEQAGGRGAVGKGTDVYGVGALLYAMITGAPPYQGATVAETCRMIRSQTPVKPSRLHPGLSPALDAICARCMHRLPTRRYGSDRTWTRLMADLRRVGSGWTAETDDWQRMSGWLRRHGQLVRIAVLLLAFALIPAAWERHRHDAAWDTLTRPDATADEYAQAARHFERQSRDEPFRPETMAGLSLAYFRTGDMVASHTERPGWSDVRDEWSAVERLTRILAALRQNRREQADAALRAAAASGYEPQSERERRLYEECQRLLAVGPKKP